MEFFASFSQFNKFKFRILKLQFSGNKFILNLLFIYFWLFRFFLFVQTSMDDWHMGQNYGSLIKRTTAREKEEEEDDDEEEKEEEEKEEEKEDEEKEKEEEEAAEGGEEKKKEGG